MKNKYRYTVRGYPNFPVDMLRYDRCWPATEGGPNGAYNILATEDGKPVEVDLVGLDRPTEGRWSSFGWHVVDGSVQVSCGGVA